MKCETVLYYTVFATPFLYEYEFEVEVENTGAVYTWY